MDFTNKVVIITGAGAGIGKSAAQLFASHNATVVLADIQIDKTMSVAASLDCQSLALQVDVSSCQQVEGLMDKVMEEFGRVDVLVNNAGIGPSKGLKTDQHSNEDWDRVIAVNQSGVYYGMKYVLKHMVEQGRGNIVNVASMAGLVASSHNISYSASKFAVVGMTKSAAMEYAANNIRVNAVCPGYTETDLLDHLLATKDGLEGMLKKRMPMKRFGSADEVADAILWLASDQSSFVTGHSLKVDGGYSL